MKRRWKGRRPDRGPIRKFGGKPSPSRLYKEMNAKGKKGKPPVVKDFVMVCFRVVPGDFRRLMKRRLDIREELFPIIKGILLTEDKKYIKPSLGHCKVGADKVAFYVERHQGTWRTPQLRCVSRSTQWEHYD